MKEIATEKTPQIRCMGHQGLINNSSVKCKGYTIVCSSIQFIRHMVKYYSSLSRTTRCAPDNDTPASKPKGTGELKYHFLSCYRIQVPQQSCLRKLPRSNVGRNTGYPNWNFSWFSFILLAICRDTTLWGHNRFQIIFNS